MGDFGGPFDAIVIGSGMSGLSAANILAKHGRKVLLIEQHYHYGGYLQSFMLHRTPFDSGCHYVGALGKGQVFDRYLRYLGVRDDIHTRELDPEGFDLLQYPSWSFSIPATYQRLAARLCDTFPHQAGPIRCFLGEIARELTGFPMYTLEQSANPLGIADPDRTLASVMRASEITDPRLIEVLTAYRMLYFVQPEEAPFSMHAFVFDSFVQGAYTIDGGGNALAKALLARLRSLGGVTRRKTKVSAIEVVDQKVRGVRTEAGEYEEAPLIIAAIDPRAALSLIPQGAVRPAYRNRVERLKPGIGGFGAYVRVEGDLSRFAGRNYWINPEDTADLLFTESWISAGTTPPVFITVPSARDPDWKGPQAVIALTGMRAEHFGDWANTWTGRRDGDYEAKKQRLGELMLEPVRKLIPEMESGLLTADYGTPLTHRDYTANTGGALYGIHHSVDQSGARGVGWRTRVGGLLLTGHSVLYPGLLGATISAFYTCGEVLGLSALHEEVRKS